MITIIVRTVFLYIFVIIGIRLMGKRQIGDMQPNELVITLLISEIAAIPLQDTSQPIINGIVAIFILVILEIIMSVFAMKCMTVRKMMNGKSVVIIKNGVVDQNAMKKVRLTVLDLIELLRGQDVFNISDVAFAVLEVNGDLSVMLKNDKQPVTAGDMKIKKADEALHLPVISDGKIISESLEALEITQNKLYKILKANKVSVADVFLLTLDRYQNINLVKKRKNT